MEKIRYRLDFSKKEELIYISHLDFLRLIERIFRKSNIPIKYSDGFNPRPKFSFPYALPLFININNEYFSCELKKDIDEDEFLNRLNLSSPKGLKFLNCKKIDKKIPPPDKHEYTMTLSDESISAWESVLKNNSLYKMLSKITEYNISNNTIHIKSSSLFNPFRFMRDCDNMEIKKSTIKEVIKL